MGANNNFHWKYQNFHLPCSQRHSSIRADECYFRALIEKNQMTKKHEKLPSMQIVKQIRQPLAGLENSTHPLVFTSASGCRASENFIISSEN